MIIRKPPMGWNTWNTFGPDISETLIMESARAMVDTGLKDAGYEYIVIDDMWSLKERDENGRLQPDPAKFPHGMKYLSDYVHSLGLKFGMYSCGGYLTCGGHPGSYGHEWEDARTFAEWGVDLLKYDYCFHPASVDGAAIYRQMGLALANCGRDILFMACSWGVNDTRQWIRQTGAHTWRSTGDINDSWVSIRDIALSQIQAQEYNAPGCYNDMDMLVVGMYGKGNVGLSGCTDIQYKTHFAIWAFLGSPLMIGCDIRNMSQAARDILTNQEMIAINQDPLLRQPYPIQGIWGNSDLLMYARNLSNGDIAIGLFNLNEEKCMARFNLDELGLPLSLGKTLEMKDIWTGKEAKAVNGTVMWELEPCDCAVFRAKLVDL